MARTFFGGAQSPGENALGAEPATLTITPPGSMVADQLVLVFGYSRTTGSLSCTVSNAGGQTWNTINITTTSNCDFVLHWCQFNGTWDASPSFAVSASGTTGAGVVMLVFTEDLAGTITWAVDQAIEIVGFGAQTTTSITGQTPSVANTLTIGIWMAADNNTWGNLTGEGWAVAGNAQYRVSAGTGSSITFAYISQDGITATGDPAKDQTAGPDGGLTGIITFTSGIEAAGGTPVENDVVSLTEHVQLVRESVAIATEYTQEISESLVVSAERTQAIHESEVTLAEQMQGVHENTNAQVEHLASISQGPISSAEHESSIYESTATLTERVLTLDVQEEVETEHLQGIDIDGETPAEHKGPEPVFNDVEVVTEHIQEMNSSVATSVEHVLYVITESGTQTETVVGLVLNNQVFAELLALLHPDFDEFTEHGVHLDTAMASLAESVVALNLAGSVLTERLRQLRLDSVETIQHSQAIILSPNATQGEILRGVKLVGASLAERIKGVKGQSTINTEIVIGQILIAATTLVEHIAQVASSTGTPAEVIVGIYRDILTPAEIRNLFVSTDVTTHTEHFGELIWDIVEWTLGITMVLDLIEKRTSD